MRILVNAVSAKKHSGGAFQIAINFIRHSFSWNDFSVEWFYIVSWDIANELSDLSNFKKKSNYYVLPTQPDFLHTYFKVRKKISQIENSIHPDVIYSITAPSYFTFRFKEVMRFTNPWVSHPNFYSWKILSYKEKMRMKFYIFIQKKLLKKAKYFITQTNLVKDNLVKMMDLPDNHVKVVPNVLPAAYLYEDKRHIDNQDRLIHIACVANSSKHKNLDIIPSVAKSLVDKYKINNFVFHLTISNQSKIWRIIQKKIEEFHLQDKIVTHGRISQQELADIYRHSDISFIPTLLEVFSATGLESAYFNLPIVSTDFQFNRDIFKDGCLYYHPSDAQDAANKIAEIINNRQYYKNYFTERNEITISQYGNYDKHFKEIVDFLKTVSTNRL